MLTAMAQLNARIGADLKHAGDKVFAAYGLTPSEVVRSVWSYAVDCQKPPEFMTRGDEAQKKAELTRRLALIEQGAGLAWKSLPDCHALARSETRPDWSAEFCELKDVAYDERTEAALAMLAAASDGGDADGRAVQTF
ncbi:MAG: type II toxin-antitoxin system RelB/DinJ family antitoxin [Coriobacteriia bacterium]|nr:type II toxin-antitoxin system RelB/DinJ family antitoxin [Coriobacteriia bacterium]MBS5479061.1 type II toxin-antitoxin system RelB/DinJ family antitoxin [Coriobacteriia bacterium]